MKPGKSSELGFDFVVVVVFGFNVPPTAKVIRRRDLGLKSHPKDCFDFVLFDLLLYVHSKQLGSCNQQG